MAVYAQLADGRVLEFPDGTDPSVVQATVKRVIASTPQPTPKKESSVLDPLKAGYGSMRSSAEKAKGELALLLGKAGLMDPTEAQEFQAKKEEAAKQFYTPTEEGWKQAPVTKTMELLGGSLPYTALPLAAAVLANPAGAVAATGAAGLASLTQFSGSNLGRQLEVIKEANPNAGLEQTSLGKAVAAAVPQAALDMISLKALPLVRNLFKSVGKDLTEAEAKKIVEQGVTRTAADYALTTGRVAGVEGLTETGQQFFERLQAGLSIADADARKEYVESFIGGAVLGGALSPAGRYFERAGERKRAEQVLKEAEVPKTQGEKLEEEGQAVAEQIVDTATPPVSVETIVDEQVKEKNKKIQKAAQTIIEQPAPIVTQPEVISEPRQDVTQPIDAGVGGRDEVPSGPERGVPAGELTTPAPVGVATDTEPVEGAVLREEARPDELKEPEVAAEEVPKAEEVKEKDYLRDNEGEPMVLYHGTDKNFSTFQLPPDETGKPRAIFVTPDVNTANRFAANNMMYSPELEQPVTEGAQVIPVRLKVSDVFDYKNPKHLNKLLRDLDPYDKKRIKEGIKDEYTTWKILEDYIGVMQDLGFDGVYVDEAGIRNIAVFDPASIESAVGKVKPKKETTVEVKEKDYLRNNEGEPLVLYRGIQSDKEGAINAEPREGYNVFVSDSPDVAATYGMPDEIHGTPGSIVPIYVKADKVIEFPVTTDKYGSRRFDKVEFDRRARSLAPGEVLVARQVVDIGPMASEAYQVDKEKKYSYYSDVYALGRGTPVESAVGKAKPKKETAVATKAKEEKVTEPEPASESDTAELIYQYDDIAPRELTSAQKQLIAEDEDILGDIRNLVVVRNEMDDISSKLSNATGALKDRLSKRYDELKERSNASLEQINQQVAALSTKKIKAEPTDIKESWDYYDPDPNEAAFVEQNLQNKTLIQAADWLTRNGPDNAYKEIARKATVKLRQLQRLGVDFSLEIIKPGDMAYAPMRYARGVAASFYSGRPHARIEVQLNGTGFPGRVGTSYGVALHEILHAALHSGITLGKYKVTENTPLGKSTKDLRDVFNFVVDNFNRKAIAVKNGKAPLSSLNPIEQKIYGGGYNFLADPEEMLVWTLTHPEARSYLESIPYKNTNRSTWDAFVGAVRKFLGLPESADTALSEVLQISEELFQTNVKDMSSLAKQVGMSLAKTSPTPKPATPKSTAPRAPFKPAPTRADRSADELLESAGEKLKNPTPIWKRLFTKGGRQDIVKKLQNDRIYAKRIEDDMNLFGKAIYAGDDKNAFYTYIIRSSGVAQVKANENLKPIESEMHDLMDDYVRKSGLELPDALRRFDLYAQAEHDFERRVVKFILRGERLLREEFDPNVDKNNMSPADEYKDIMQRLPNAKSAKEAKDLRKQMDDLMFSKIDVDKDVAVANAKNFKKVPPEFLNVKSDNYEVSGKTYAEIQSIKKDLMAKDKNIAIYNDLMEVIQKKLQPATKDLNREANHWTRPVDNTAEFYGYKHYVPLKGRPDVSQKEDNDLELTGRKLAGEGQDIEIGFEGRQTDPDNAILQSLADAYRGAMRAGRKDFFDALANASAKNKLNPKGQDILTKRVETPKGVKLVPMVEVVKNVQFQDRRSLDDVKNIKGEANVFRYNKDGSIDVIKIRDPQLAEAIRRTYRTSNPFWDKLNKATSLIAQGHTRYNPSFAPVNFVADVFTNAYTMGAELGPKKSLEMLWAVATDVGTNGLVYKTGKFAQLFNSGKVGEIRKLAAKDPFYNELLEYVEEGGKVSYIQGLANKGQLEELNQRLGPSKVLRTKAQIDTIFDIYTDAFELASRVAAYRVAKSQFRAEGLKEKDARVKAATYAKNLANFELIGEKGKELGALYMFGRQAMTGAVRAVDALSNAMSFDEKAFKDAAKAKGYSAAEIDKGLKTRKEQQKSARLTTMALLGAGAAAYMMAYLASDDDEQGRNRVETDDMSRWVRNLRIPIPGTDQFFQLRWGFGLGAFASMGAQVAGAFTSNTPLEDTFFNMISAAFESFAGLPVSKINMFDNFPAFLVDSIMPSVIRPVLEYAMNIDSLGREIYNNRTSRYGDAYTGGDNIPEMYKQAAAFLADITNGAIDWSPNTMYFFANNYFDAVSRYANYISGLTMTAAGSKDLSPKDIPIVESFLSGKSSVDSREFAKVEEKVKDMERKLKMFENNPEQYLRYLEAHPSHPALVDFYNAQINGSLKDLRTVANNVRRTQDFSPKERNELLKEIKLAQDLTKRVLIDTFKELNVEPGMFRGSGD